MTNDEAHQRFYVEPAVAFIRGTRDDAPELPDGVLIVWGKAAGLRIHRFKRSGVLPRVQRIIGFLHAIRPDSLLDIGSGRGTALWPMMDSLTELDFTSTELHPERLKDLRAVSAGGLERLCVIESDAQALDLPADSIGAVTLLEVLEHMPDPLAAMRRALSVSRGFIAITVPSKEDNNPEHIHLFTRTSLTDMLREAGARRVQVEYILNHIIAFARSTR